MKNIFLLCLLVLFSCKSDKKQVGLDLMQYGLPIKINAPQDSEVKFTDYGFAKDVTVKDGEDYDIQIVSGDAITYDIAKLLGREKDDVEAGLYFSKFIQEDEAGFIYEKKITEEKLKYDFRYIKIQGDKEYLFQSGLTGNFNEEQIRKMYESVQ